MSDLEHHKNYSFLIEISQHRLQSKIEMYLAGISVHRVEDIAEALWGTRVSPSTLSNHNQKVYSRIDQWLNSPLEGEYTYAFLDDIWLKRSWIMLG